MYSYEDRIKAVRLYLKLGKRLGVTIRQLGYPTKNTLIGWYREFIAKQSLRAGYTRARDRYTVVQKQHAVQHYLDHGRCIAFTLRVLGYPSRATFSKWLDERHPAVPLLPAVPEERAIVRSMAQIICCDIHPLNNLRVLNALRGDFRADEDAISAWIGRWINEGFSAIEALIGRHGGRFAFSDEPSLVDCCLVPQVYSALRFQIDISMYPAIAQVLQSCNLIEAFAKAHPSQQSGAS